MTHQSTSLSPGLDRLVAELDAASRRADALVTPLDDRGWSTRPPQGGWCVAECLVHLNTTSEQFLPRIHDAMGRARTEGLVGPDRARADMWGRVLRWYLEPPYRLKTKTPAGFAPTAIDSRELVLRRFHELQAALAAAVRDADGVRISDVTLVSPFDGRIRYSVYSAFTIIPSHQRRHLWQAERVLAALRLTG